MAGEADILGSRRHAGTSTDSCLLWPNDLTMRNKANLSRKGASGLRFQVERAKRGAFLPQTPHFPLPGKRLAGSLQAKALVQNKANLCGRVVGSGGAVVQTKPIPGLGPRDCGFRIVECGLKDGCLR